MQGVVIGKRIIDYKNKTTGKQVNLIELHISGKDARVEGSCVSTVVSSPDKLGGCVVGEEYVFMYDQRQDGKAVLAMVMSADLMAGNGKSARG